MPPRRGPPTELLGASEARPVRVAGSPIAFPDRGTAVVNEPHDSVSGHGAPEPAVREHAAVGGTVRDVDGRAVPGAALTLVDPAGHQVVRGTADADGRYVLGVPGVGGYVLIAAAAGHRPQAVTVTAGGRPAVFDVLLAAAGRLVGTVQAAWGAPVADAAVTLLDAHGDVVARTRSGPEGGFVLAAVVVGACTLAVSAPAFRPAALPVSLPSARDARQDVTLTAGAALRGVVRAGGGHLVQDARLTLFDRAGNVVDTVLTAPDGLFHFADLATGAYTLIAAGYPPAADAVRVAAGGRARRDLRLAHPD